MTAAEVMQVAREALVLTGMVAGPLLLTSLVVGVAVGLLQALTQVQEMTLTFVPKIVAMGGVLLLMLPTIGRSMAAFTARVADLMIAG